MKITHKKLILCFLISAFVINPSFAATSNKSIANTSTSKKSSGGISNTGEKQSSEQASTDEKKTFNEDICKKIEETNKNAKDDSKNQVKEGIKPVKGSITGWSCTDDLWKDMTNLWGSIGDLWGSINPKDMACGIAQGGADALAGLAGSMGSAFIKAGVKAAIAKSGIKEPIDMLKDTNKYLGTAENNLKTKNLVKTANNEMKREYEDVLYNTDSKSRAEHKYKKDFTY